jgi:hypothetical protein
MDARTRVQWMAAKRLGTEKLLRGLRRRWLTLPSGGCCALVNEIDQKFLSLAYNAARSSSESARGAFVVARGTRWIVAIGARIP